MNDSVLLQDSFSGNWLQFNIPIQVVEAHTLDEVEPALEKIERLVNKNGWYAAGYLSFEAAGAFDASLVTHAPKKMPLLWFGLYTKPLALTQPPETEKDFYLGGWQPTVGREAYLAAIEQVHAHIARGETYQVNYTMRLKADFDGEAYGLFDQLAKAQQSADFMAYIETDNFAICSASPELFFTLDDTTLTSLPMKGTTGRGLSYADDEAARAWLAQDEKNRAENVMIVDMIRNDMGRVAKTGSVRVPSLFDVQRLPTLHTMTSTVTAETDASLSEIMRNLFPCASITGAPKVWTMEIITNLEPDPRGVYCGAIGYFAPNRRAQFNVAIRTVVVDKVIQEAEYGVGGGVVWDSTGEGEYGEALLKASVLLNEPMPPFDLLEAILWEPELGYFLLDYHLKRVGESADYFNIPVNVNELAEKLHGFAEILQRPTKVRVIIGQTADILIEGVPVTPTDLPANPIVALAAQATPSDNVFLYHKTSRRGMYAQAKASRPDVDDVILWNERGELTEATSSNLVVQLDGLFYTPPVSAGLLNGTLRQSLLESGEIAKRVLLKGDLQKAEAVYLINSIRRWRKAIFKM